VSKALKTSIVAILITIAGGGVYLGYRYFLSPEIPEVDAEPILRRNLQALVSASGTIQPQLTVDISANVMGRVTQLSVNEGDRVVAGQFLLQIDPESLQSVVERGEASLEASSSAQEQAKVIVATARVNLELARDNLERQRELWDLQLVSREIFDQAVSEVQLRETELEAREVDVSTAEQRVNQERATLNSARYDLSELTLVSPIDGIVTRRNIEEGETVVVGTMNNPGTVLLTIADFGILEAELEVDETDIPDVRLGQQTEIEIDALPNRLYRGRVTEIGNSPIQDSTQNSSQATNFKVIVTLDEDVPDVRPGFTCTADITTAERTDAVSVPIQATTVREVTVDSQGQIVRATPGNAPSGVTPTVSASTLTAPIGATQEIEGVFLFRNDTVQFTPVVTGIAGERYFETLAGLREGDMVVTGPFNVVRTLDDGSAVRLRDDESGQSGFFFGSDARGRLGRVF
jgi:HlyD family secretion protein